MNAFLLKVSHSSKYHMARIITCCESVHCSFSWINGTRDNMRYFDFPFLITVDLQKLNNITLNKTTLK